MDPTHIRISRLASRIAVKFRLNEREADVLRLTLMGFSENDAARELERSRAIVQLTLDTVASKLGALSREEIFVKALEVATA